MGFKHAIIARAWSRGALIGWGCINRTMRIYVIGLSSLVSLPGVDIGTTTGNDTPVAAVVYNTGV